MDRYARKRLSLLEKCAFKIRRTRNADKVQLEDLDRECFGSSGSDFQESKGTYVIVAEKDGKIAGAICYEVEAERIYLAHVGTFNAFRRQKVASTLVSYLIEKRMPRHRRQRVELIVIQGNDGARKCYKSIGFRFDGSADTSSDMYFVRPKGSKKHLSTMKSKRNSSSSRAA